jgi:uncharacterized membrane protein
MRWDCLKGRWSREGRTKDQQGDQAVETISIQEMIMFFSPFTALFVLILFFSLVLLFFLIQINLITLAFEQIGIPSHYIFLAFLLSLFGSFVNIPVKKIPQEGIEKQGVVNFFGFRHVVPVWTRKETLLAVNLGGAVIPALISAYLLLKTGLWLQACIATTFMTFVAYRLARPLKGVGIALPAFIPPILAALISVIVAYQEAPVVAYISGTMGTLIGADLLHLGKIKDLGAPVASIGGAGTFDGIFLNGILAVLLSAILI